jgi:hypothetical protein
MLAIDDVEKAWSAGIKDQHLMFPGAIWGYVNTTSVKYRSLIINPDILRHHYYNQE